MGWVTNEALGIKAPSQKVIGDTVPYRDPSTFLEDTTGALGMCSFWKHSPVVVQLHLPRLAIDKSLSSRD